MIIPNIWEQQTFIEKAGNEILNQMWAFKDKGNRDVCLIPEVTGCLQEKWRDEWSKKSKQRKVFYVNRCYRYERPQKGRYREFTQLGIEILGSNDSELAKSTLINCLNLFDISYEFKDNVKRGLSYYIDDGFEVEVSTLGTQKQIAGGGKYDEGVGWAIGIDRLILSLE